MERLVIINHDIHHLIVDDVSDELLAKYNGEEEAYIKDTYPALEHYSWDYITDAVYFPSDDDGDPIEIDFNDIKQ